MDIHSLARLVPQRRVQMVQLVEQGLSVTAAARLFMVSRQTVYKWVGRFRAGDRELCDRSSRPLNSPRRLDETQLALIRLCRMGQLVISAIAASQQLVRSTVGRHVRSMGLGKLPREPRPPACRYEHPAPGDLLHIDIKKLRVFDSPGRRYQDQGGLRQRGASRICLHAAVDDHSRLAYVELLPRENAEACCGFMARAVAWFAAQGVQVRRIITDNAKAYRGRALAQLCRDLGIKQSFTRPYRPQTNGKVERFLRTISEQWAAPYYRTSDERDSRLADWIHYYNYERSHSAIGYRTPASRLSMTC